MFTGHPDPLEDPKNGPLEKRKAPHYYIGETRGLLGDSIFVDPLGGLGSSMPRMTMPSKQHYRCRQKSAQIERQTDDDHVLPIACSVPIYTCKKKRVFPRKFGAIIRRTPQHGMREHFPAQVCQQLWAALGSCV